MLPHLRHGNTTYPFSLSRRHSQNRAGSQIQLAKCLAAPWPAAVSDDSKMVDGLLSGMSSGQWLLASDPPGRTPGAFHHRVGDAILATATDSPFSGHGDSIVGQCGRGAPWAASHDWIPGPKAVALGRVPRELLIPWLGEPRRIGNPRRPPCPGATLSPRPGGPGLEALLIRSTGRRWVEVQRE